MTDDYMLDKVLDKTKKIIDIKKIDNARIVTDTDDKLFDKVVLKKGVIFTLQVIKVKDKFYPQIFLEEA